MHFLPCSRSLLLLLLIALVISSIPASFAQQELVQNGGFEKKFEGWTNSNSQVLKQSSSIPSHSGGYSAKIGTSTRQGQISQTVKIPAKSSVKFTAYYRLEKSASLTTSLKRGDGSLIQEWSKSGMASWTSVTYSLDVSYAGQSVVIEFTGIGYRETVTVMGWCQGFDPVTGTVYTYLCQFYDYNDYYSYVDDVSMMSQVAIYETTISVTGLPPGLSTGISVDGSQKGTIGAGGSKTLQFNIGENHRISVDTYVYKDNKTRYHCSSDSVSVDTDRSLTFSYAPEYFLAVSSQFGTVSGSDWYDEGSKATFAVDRNAFPMTGIIGSLGAKHVFEKWGGDASVSSVGQFGSTKGEIIMNGPKSVSAVWRDDYTFLYLSVGVIAAAIAGGGFAVYSFIARRRPLKAPLETAAKLPDETMKTKEPQTIAPEAAPEEREVLALLERLEKSYRDGTVNDKVYQKLKAEFETRLADARARGAG
jgi:hypothetical protein